MLGTAGRKRRYERERIIRNEGQQQLNIVAAIHAKELKEKKGVLDLARGLLSDARYDSQVACSKSSTIRTEDKGVNKHEAHGGESDNENQESGLKRRAIIVKMEGDGGGDGKRPRIKQEGDDNNNNTGQVTAAAEDNTEKQATESIREHLLALSYAMFDTLYLSMEPSAFSRNPFASFS